MDNYKLIKKDRKSRRGEVVLHIKDQLDHLEISYRIEDRSVDQILDVGLILEDWRSWYMSRG